MQNIAEKMPMDRILLSFIIVMYQSIYPYRSRLLHWYCGSDCSSGSETTMKNI